MNGIEHVSDRMNPLIDPALSIWQWQIPVYLFLGGLVAGIMIIASAQEILWPERWNRKISFWGSIAAFFGLSLGMLALFLDLSHKLYVWRFYLALKPLSPMSWGSWILILVYPLLLMWFLGSFDPEAAPRRLRDLLRGAHDLAVRWRRAILGLNVLVGAALGVYTGILLQTLMARPLWATGLLGPLFLASGMSAGAAFLMLLKESRTVVRDLLRWDAAILVVELALLALFFVERYAGGFLEKASAGLLVTGPFAGSFFGLVIAGGILVPLLIELGELRGKIRGTVVAPLLVLLGSFALRFILVAAGQISSWDMLVR
jgi:protein NrfD